MRKEFTFSIQSPKGGTEALTIEASSIEEAKEKIAKAYPGYMLLWIL